MIVVNAVMESTTENIDALKSAIATMETRSRAEPGCLDYAFSIELSRPGVIRITERWESLDALKEHFAQPHMAEFRAVLGEHPPSSATAHFYEAQEMASPLA